MILHNYCLVSLLGRLFFICQELQEQEKKFEEKLEQQRKKFKEQLQQQERKQNEKLEHNKTRLETLERLCGLNWKFTMENFSAEKARDRINEWKSPPMYTHVCGYKFCVGIDANGFGESRGESVNVNLWAMKGEYDDQLKWPVMVKFTIELVNHFPNGESIRVTKTMKWGNKSDHSCNYLRIGRPGQDYIVLS